MGTIRQLGMVVAAAVLGLGTGCGKDSNGPGNSPPTANFASACTDLACTFTDLSVDSDGQLRGYAWDFADGGTATTASPSHTYTTAGNYSVKLTVTDNDGDEGTATKVVAVAAPPGPGGPTAKFKVSCFSLDCTFEDQSTDPDGSVVAWEWDFGDGGGSTVQNPGPHHFDATGLTTFTATLKVTDDAALSSTASQQFTVAPPATLKCDGVDCSLVLEQDATVKVTLESSSCSAHNNTFVITAPAIDTLFKDGCYSPPAGTSFDLNDGNAYTANTQLDAVVISGSLKLKIAPAVRVKGAYPTWTIEFDDGQVATPPDEPDFNDLIITVTATPVP
jgi:PKD repeat protein